MKMINRKTDNYQLLMVQLLTYTNKFNMCLIQYINSLVDILMMLIIKQIIFSSYLTKIL